MICAPTSSGKTILSSYVAFIFKATSSKAEKDEAMLETRKKNPTNATTSISLLTLKEEEEDDDGDMDGDDGKRNLVIISYIYGM